MKSCKKITAAVLAAILALSIFICPAFAGGAFIDPSSETITTTPPDQSPDDLTFVPPSMPEEETTARVPATGTDKDVLENVSFFQKIFNSINDFFNLILEYIAKLGDVLGRKN